MKLELVMRELQRKRQLRRNFLIEHKKLMKKYLKKGVIPSSAVNIMRNLARNYSE